MAVLGVVVSIVGLVLTIVLTDETGAVRPDSECSTTMRASVVAVECVVSNDPKVLLGVAPLLLGLAMVGIGIWRAIAAPSAGGSSDGGGGVGIFGSLSALQDKAMKLQESAMGTMTAGDTPPAATPTPPAPTAPAPPPTPPAPRAPGEDA